MRHVLSGNIPTRVPGVREAPTELPEPAVASTFVPAPVVAETDLPVDFSVATALPAQAVVPTELPFWIRKIMGVLAGQAEIRVQVLTWDMAGTEALRGQGAIVVEPVSIDTGAPTQALRGRGAISALASMVLPAGARELAGRGAVLVSALMSLPAGVRTLGARGAVGAAVSTVSMSAGTRSLGGRAQISVTAGYPSMSPAVSTFESAGSFSYALPYWWRYLDIILIGGGASGQTGNGAVNSRGDGGRASAWVTVTVERGVDVPAMATTLDVVVGAGGALAANSDHAGPNAGEASSVSVPGGASVSAPGGAGENDGVQNGQAPGNITYQTISRDGGAAGTGNGGAATAPGAAGAGGNGGIFGSRTRGGAGARGEVVIRARQ